MGNVEKFYNPCSSYISTLGSDSVQTRNCHGSNVRND
jgi:hypothetical protein